MRRLLLVAVLAPVALASGGDPVKSRWRSLTSGNLFEVTDFGERLSIRFLASEVVEDQSTEKPDIAVNFNGPRQQLRPGRWLLQKRADGKYVGAANSEMSCTYQDIWVGGWHDHVCKFSDAVELSMTATEISGWRDGSPASKSTFNCGKCKFSKTERSDLQWALEERRAAPQQETSATPVAATPRNTASPPVGAEGRGVFAIESTPPGAEVYIDGEFVGTSPIAEHSLTAGKHEIELRKKGFAPWKRQLSVSAGARATVAAEMEP